MLLEDALLEENNLIEVDTLTQAKRLIEAKSMQFAELPGPRTPRTLWLGCPRGPAPRALRLKENEKGSLLSLAKASKN